MTPGTSLFVVATAAGDDHGETIRAILATQDAADDLAERLADDEGINATSTRYVLGRRYDADGGEDGLFVMGKRA